MHLASLALTTEMPRKTDIGNLIAGSVQLPIPDCLANRAGVTHVMQ
jgi:hypothetical protein